jgi:hypothetical protein
MLHVYVTLPAHVPTARAAFEEGKLLPNYRGPHKFVTYEAKTLYPLRFM